VRQTRLIAGIDPAIPDDRAPRRRRRLVFTAALVLVAIGIVMAIDRLAPAPAAPAPAAAPAMRHGYGPATYAAALTRADEDVLLGEERVAREPAQWVFQEYLAQALLVRARLTGSFIDLAHADAALAHGLASAPPNTGPRLMAAIGAMAIHRLGSVTALLDAHDTAVVPAGSAERAEVLALRGDRAFYAGDIAAARRAYAAAMRIHAAAGIAVRLANLYRAQGEFAAAEAQIAAALAMTKTPSRALHADLLLQQGAIRLSYGDWSGAQTLFAAADHLFPGNWRTQALLAQMAAVRGDTAGAEGLYRTILAGNPAEPPPEIMDALAALYRAGGNIAASRAWADRAAARWATRMALLPEAAVGHALEHELVFGTPARALALARQNVAARPYGDTNILLARALLQNGDPAAAVAVLARVAASGWRSADQYALLAQAQALLGHGDAADAAQARALAINPRALDPALPLLWFGTH
jgi:tetratricopeptide (TPR) repeat protein